MLGRWWETVPPLGLLFHLALGGDDRSELLCGVQPGRHIFQDAHETHVVLWRRPGRSGEIAIYPTTEPYAGTLVRVEGEWIRDDSWRLDCDVMDEGQDVVAIV